MARLNLPKGCKEKDGQLTCIFEGLDGKPFKQDYRIRLGETYLFEYHCWENEESSDATLWHHTHQKAKVLNLQCPGAGHNEKERAKGGESAYFRVKFKDGFESDAGEDELVISRKQFYRPDYIPT